MFFFRMTGYVEATNRVTASTYLARILFILMHFFPEISFFWQIALIKYLQFSIGLHKPYCLYQGAKYVHDRCF